MISTTLFLAICLQTTAPDEPTENPDEQLIEETEQDPRVEMGIEFSAGPFTGKMKNRALLEVPEGYQFADAKNAQALMEMYGNLVDGTEVGYVEPMNDDWFIIYEFSDIGYVKDDDKDLDADDLLDSMKEGQAQANEVLESRGMSTLEILDWAIPPRYNDETQNLEWATRARSSEGDDIVNFKTKRLGRKGVMNVTLVCDPDALDGNLPNFRNVMAGFTFAPGETYAEFREGDKVAEYGLAALVTGGALAVAAKTGFLKKFGKFLILIPIAIFAFFKKLFGRRSSSKAAQES